MVGGFFVFGNMALEIQIWDCRPLVVVHAEDDVVFTADTKVEFEPDDESEQSGKVRSYTSTAEGWTPEMRFTQKLETLQFNPVFALQKPGLILIGEDANGEPFTWYINGEADRFLLPPSDPVEPEEFESVD